MISAFSQYLHNILSINPKDRVLLAVSGGLDSTVMAHLFYESKLQFGIAHCNFQLRGPASGADEEFVKTLAKKLKAPCFTTRFETAKHAKENKISIQEAARDLRYQWLQEIAKNRGFDWIATAHHQDDSVETMLFNLIKGCGIKGLHGILPKQKNIIRPLMFTGRKELEQWAQKKAIEWREDASNASDKYDRNKIRHHIIPEMEKINPSFRKTAVASIQRFKEAQDIVELFVARFRDEAFCISNGRLCLKKAAFRYGDANRTLLYELLAPYGFNQHQTEQILSRLDAPAGGIFHSPTHQLLNDRETLILTQKQEHLTKEEFELTEAARQVELPGGVLLIEKLNNVPLKIDNQANVALLDADKLKFPLRLRRWRKGDRFQPLGMGGKSKKVQDLFSDSKLSRFDKEQVWILESQGKICWIVGMRLDERYKIDENTTSCWEVSWVPDSFAGQHLPYTNIIQQRNLKQ